MINTVVDTPTGYSINGTVFVPSDPANVDYQAVQEWIADGNIPVPYVAPAAPAPLTNAQKLEQSSGLTIAEIQAVLGV